MRKYLHHEAFENGAYIRAYQDFERVERYPGAGESEIALLKTWEGKVELKEKATDQRINIREYFPEYSGVAFLSSLLPGMVDFQGSDQLMHNGREIL
jgi:hypothetical protein